MEATNNRSYNVDSIQSLSPREFTRLRPQVYCGSTEYSTQLLVEILANSVDEHRLGHGNKITIVSRHAPHEYFVKVIDEGQGFIPNSMREDGKTILEAAFSVLNTSGKFSEDGVYEGSSLGSFGIGSKLQTFLSSHSVVETYRDGMMEYVSFVDGEFSRRRVAEVDKNRHGTSVTWWPDPQFFTHVEINVDEVKDLCQTIACLCPGLTIEFYIDDDEPIIYHSENGLADLADKYIGDGELLNNRLVIKEPKFDLVLTYTDGYNSTVIPYVNTGLTEKGPHITNIKNTITRKFNDFFREKKWLKQKDENFSGDDIQEGMFLVFNLTASNVAYDAQVKSNVTRIDMSGFTETLAMKLEDWFLTSEKDVKLICDKALKARKAREAARAARDAVREHEKRAGENKKRKVLAPDKFKDCEKHGEDSMLIICEGNSALSGLMPARNIDTEALYAVRGKVKNALKSSLSECLKNAEVNDIISILGCGIKDNYDSSKLNYGKVAISVDADVDGFNIMCLISTLFWVLMPNFIKEGRLCWLRAPLYRLQKGSERVFAYNDEELKELRKTHKNWIQGRNKGYEVVWPLSL